MWKCEQCESIFEEYNRVLDPEVGYLNCCPHCGCDGVVAVFECVVCGEYAEDTTHGACPECYDKIKKKVKAFVDDMTEAEYEVFLGVLEEG